VSETGDARRPLRIWLVGFGTVGRWLAQVLGSQAERLAARYGVDVSVVGIATARHGLVYNEDGLDLTAVLSAMSEGRSLTDLTGVRCWPTTIAGPHDGGNVTARIQPELVHNSDRLANVNGTSNAVVCEVSPLGEITIIGPGAGVQLAGQGVLSDVIAVATTRPTSS
jgi:homoserine dehydrogenase